MILAAGVSTGVGISKALVLKKRKETIPLCESVDIEHELDKLNYCIKKTYDELNQIYDAYFSQAYGPLMRTLKKYMKIINNPGLIEDIKKKIVSEKVSASYAVSGIMEDFERVLSNVDDEYLYDKCQDIEEIKQRLLKNLTGYECNENDAADGECILVAEDFTPGDVLKMDPNLIKGIVTILGSPSSSASAAARHMGIPAVTGAGYEGIFIKNGDLLIVDGNRGMVIVNPDDNELNEYGAGNLQF